MLDRERSLSSLKMQSNVRLFLAALGFPSVLSAALIFPSFFFSPAIAKAQAPHTSDPSLPTGMGPLRVHPANPRYLQNSSGKAVYLSGSTFGWELLGSNNNTADFGSYLHLIKMNDHNLIRLSSNENTWRVGYSPITSTTRAYSQKMNIAAMTPQACSASTQYCLAGPGSEYLVYQPTAGQSFTVDLVAGTYTYEWFDRANSTVARTGSFTAPAGNRSFTAPFLGDAVLYLKSSITTPTPPESSSWFPQP
jgi:hypothetical protein